MKKNTIEQLLDEEEKTDGRIISIGHLLDYLKRLSDSRKRRGMRYKLEIVLLLYMLAKLCGQNKVSGIADWIQLRAGYLCTALKLKNNKLPHHSTYRRILSEVINADEFEQTIAEYLLQLPRSGQDMIIAIDGKTVRGTITAGDPFGLHLLAAYLPGEGIVLMQMVVDKEKENEIVVASNLLNCLDLRNKVVTGDAMHTQRQLSAQIVSMGGNFVWIVKDNQPKTLKAIELLFTPAQPITENEKLAMGFRSETTIDKQCGRVEKRTIIVSTALNHYLDWPHLAQVFKLERHFTSPNSKKTDIQVLYGITSLHANAASPAQLLDMIRVHWGIENGLHYRRDVTYQEDLTRMSKKMGRTVSTINNLLVSLLNCLGFDNHAYARRVFDASLTRSLALFGGL